MANSRLGPAFNIFFPYSGTFQTQLVDGTTDGAGAVFQVPKDGVIDRIGFTVTARAGSAATMLDVRLETSAAGQPSGTLIDDGVTDDARADHAATTTGWRWVTLGTPYAVTAGDIVAPVVRGGAGADGANNATICYSTLTGKLTMFPVGGEFDATVWTPATDPPTVACRYDSDGDDEVVGPVDAFDMITYEKIDLDSESDPDELGVEWVAWADGEIGGAEAYVDTATRDATGVFTIYEDGSSIATRAYTFVHVRAASHGIFTFMFPPVAIEATKTYKLVWLPDADVDFDPYGATFPDVESRIACYGDGFRTGRTNGGGWVDLPLQAVSITPLITSITPGGGGGGILIHPGMTGGMNG